MMIYHIVLHLNGQQSTQTRALTGLSGRFTSFRAVCFSKQTINTDVSKKNSQTQRPGE